MKRIVCILLILCVMLILGENTVRQGRASPALSRVPEGQPTQHSLLKCLYYDEKSFKSSINQNGGYSCDGGSISLLGGILPHHLVAAPMIARFFSLLGKNAEDQLTIIVMAPNHKRVGDRNINTGNYGWDTPFGILEADHEIIAGLVEDFGAGDSPQLLEQEHSVAALIPYIKYTFPKAAIVPVLIHGGLGKDSCIKLSNYLINEARIKPCLILASIDFSHGLAPLESVKRDKITQRIIEERDYDALLEMDNTYFDAPPTLAAFLMTMDGLAGSGLAEGTLLENSEASQFLGQLIHNTTSYMTYIFAKAVN